MIFINKDVPGDRWRFTLAHELAHLVMHDIPKPDMEDEADEFASEF
ncbi:MAG: ImmA/IrrE family metallo-endopeptidase [Xanthomonadales bacterium]|nr:ImmA/IrrE family metallo-endopeptidase [Xanthomonadales bacterium]